MLFHTSCYLLMSSLHEGTSSLNSLLFSPVLFPLQLPYMHCVWTHVNLPLLFVCRFFNTLSKYSGAQVDDLLIYNAFDVHANLALYSY